MRGEAGVWGSYPESPPKKKTAVVKQNTIRKIRNLGVRIITGINVSCAAPQQTGDLSGKFIFIYAKFRWRMKLQKDWYT